MDQGILEENGAAWVAIAMLGLLVWLAIFAIWLSWQETEHTANEGILGLVRRVVLQAPRLFKAAAVYGLLAGAVAVFLGWQNEVWEPGALESPSPDSPVYDIAIFAGVFLVAFLALRVWRYFGLKFVPLVVLVAALVAFAAYRDFFVVEFFKVQIALKGNLVDIAVAIAIIVPGAFMLRSIWTGAGSSEEGPEEEEERGDPVGHGVVLAPLVSPIGASCVRAESSDAIAEGARIPSERCAGSAFTGLVDQCRRPDLYRRRQEATSVHHLRVATRGSLSGNVSRGRHRRRRRTGREGSYRTTARSGSTSTGKRIR